MGAPAFPSRVRAPRLATALREWVRRPVLAVS